MPASDHFHSELAIPSPSFCNRCSRLATSQEPFQPTIGWVDKECTVKKRKAPIHGRGRCNVFMRLLPFGAACVEQAADGKSGMKVSLWPQNQRSFNWLSAPCEKARLYICILRAGT